MTALRNTLWAGVALVTGGLLILAIGGLTFGFAFAAGAPMESLVTWFRVGCLLGAFVLAGLFLFDRRA